MRIVHGDIKLENCLVDLTQDSAAGGNILLCDFGLARFIKYADDNENAAGLPKQQQQSQLSDKFCLTGSLQYAAPEIIQATHQDESSSPAVDIWAFAVTVYTLHTGSLPFNHSLQPKLASMILNGTWDVDRLRNCWGLAKAGKTETENVVQVVKGGLCKNTSRRWNIGDVLDSAWLENYG
jgi:serine/threonine protein kinase